MKYSYYALCLDPVHIGAGGYRLGRVDNTIVREPATNVPKIPGTSIAGAIRAYTTYYFKEHDPGCQAKDSEQEKDECARGKADLYFGDTKRQGMIRFYDAQIVLFPVTSTEGTIWITTRSLLEYWVHQDVQGEASFVDIPENRTDEAHIIRWNKSTDTINLLNLGWLLLPATPVSLSNRIRISDELSFADKIVVVSDSLFSNIVNDNLEVRTSVRIDPETGAAADGALFTYEAIPRWTVLCFELVIDPTKRSTIEDIRNILRKSFSYLELLGIGGMGTRGFGRIRVTDRPAVALSKNVTKDESGPVKGGGAR
jgi:CRISPR-associated protein Cmr4